MENGGLPVNMAPTCRGREGTTNELGGFQTSGNLSAKGRGLVGRHHPFLSRAAIPSAASNVTFTFVCPRSKRLAAWLLTYELPGNRGDGVMEFWSLGRSEKPNIALLQHSSTPFSLRLAGSSS